MRDNGSVASYIWLTTSVDEPVSVPFASPRLRLVVQRGSAYIWDCVTAPAFRGIGLYRNGLLSARSICFERTIQRAHIAYDGRNVASIKGILGAGFSKQLKYRLIRLGAVWPVAIADSRILPIRNRELDFVSRAMSANADRAGESAAGRSFS
ncbi:MAG: hypothetical protein O3A47_03020 [Chloroflexi bacterium]|nr:hypothetical protein [Chloroflexota bacterium]